MNHLYLLFLLIALFFAPVTKAQNEKNRSLTENLPEKSEIIVPDTTINYATKDGQSLFMDIYHPSDASQCMYHGKKKPAILYIFGGAFVTGERDAILQLRYYKRLTELGFSVIAIDYRLGMKDMLTQKVSMIKLAKGLQNSLQMAVEDLYSATSWLLDHGDEVGINADNMVISGSSAGAMTVLQADYQMCNRSKFDVALPQGFKYKGIISFSGGVFTHEGKPDYRERTPSPTLLLHGVEDRIVHYKKIQFFNIGFFGSSTLVKRLKKYGCNYNIFRYIDSGHEVAGSLSSTLTQQLNFIYENIMDEDSKLIDASLNDPNIDHRFIMRTYKDIKSFAEINPDK